MTWSQNRNGIGGGSFHSSVYQAGTINHAGTINFAAPRTPRPALAGLPPGARQFVGREAESALLDAALAPGGGTVVAVVGPPGVGKTELVVQAARRTAGQVLFVDLAGYDPERRLDPAEALDGFLRALGLPPEDVPPAPQDKSRAYRSLLAEPGPPVLVVLDNAFSAEQVAPLLPGGTRASTLITSRHTLAVDARLLELAVLEQPFAVRLLDSVLRTARPEDDRLTRHPADAAELAHLCEGLPLALRIAAALLADTPTRPPSSLVAALRDERTRLQRLRHRELAVRAAFALSHAHLSPDAARVFALFALNPGPDLATSTVAAAVEADEPDAEELLGELVQAHLVEAGEQWGRWRMHDLMRLFAAEQQPDRQAQDRLHAHYLGLLDGPWQPERRNLVALAVAEPPLGRPGTTMELALRFTALMAFDGHYDDSLALLNSGLDLARRPKDHEAAAYLLGVRGTLLCYLGYYGKAEADLRKAADVAARLGDRTGEAMALVSLGGLLNDCERYHEAEQALQHAEALEEPELFSGIADQMVAVLSGKGRHADVLAALRGIEEDCRAVDDGPGLAEVLHRQWTCLMSLGRTQEGMVASAESIRLYAESGDRPGQVMALCQLGGYLGRTGEVDRALALHHEAMEICQESGSDGLLAHVRSALGETLCNAGRYIEALENADRAVEVARAYGHPQSVAIAVQNRAATLVSSGRVEEGLEATRTATAIFQELGDAPRLARALRNQARALDCLGRHEEAEAVLARIAEW
ncbi:hypothetical protein GCM10009759_19930 [Kitasatospora saccharophila]|uniref:AAA+ ATPase domain-containing protein n=1 Tax=Kitasatospora saccharophila TaxID=407973 RepID=A0ABN2WLB2_9ACTN